MDWNKVLSSNLHPGRWNRGAQVAGGCLGTVILLYNLYKYQERRQWKKLRTEWNSVPKDTVVLHQFFRGKFCPNLSPFALKIETYLRLNDIKYIVDTKKAFGPQKGKCPWITLNGEEIEDSEIVKNALQSNFEIKIDNHLSEEEKAQLELSRIIADEYLFWFVITWRYYMDRCKVFMTTQNFKFPMTKLFPLFMVSGIKQKSVMHGMGTFPEEEVFQMFKNTCKSLSLVLGNKNFYGGESPATADCSIFGALSQIMWNAPDTKYEKVLKETYPNLGDYCNRMKNRVFPDWEQVTEP